MRKELNCWRTNNRTMIESAEFKRSVINYYKRTVNVDSFKRENNNRTMYGIK